MSKFKKYQRLAALQSKLRRIPNANYFLNFSKYNSIPKPLNTAKPLAKIDLAQAFNIRVGDLVQVLRGQDENRQGVVLRIFKSRNQLIVENCNMRQSFWNPDWGPGKPSIKTQEMPIHVVNVALVDPVTKQPTIVKRRYMMNGECVRICKASGCALPEPTPVAHALYRKPPKRQTPIKQMYAHRDYENFNLLTRLAREIKDRNIAMALAPRMQNTPQ